jgi:hypothetical protein
MIMAQPKKQWQLLLVADDGRIIPFKRIKGIVLTLMIFLVVLGLLCAGLGWQLAAEKIRHRQTLDQLTDANRQAAHYKSQHELIAAELVLAEARMEKKGLSIPRRQDRVLQQKPAETIDSEPVRDVTVDDRDQESKTVVKVNPTAKKPSSVLPAAATVAEAPQHKTPEATAAKAPLELTFPEVALGDLEMKHNPAKKSLFASLRVKNTGPLSSPVSGRCVVVLKNKEMDFGTWLAIPRVPLMNGQPDGKQGQKFKISSYIDLKIKAAGIADPSSYDKATVYVFDISGAKILEKDFKIDLPAPKPSSKTDTLPASLPGKAHAKTDAPTVPVGLPSKKMPVSKRVRVKGPKAASGNIPTATPDADIRAGAQPVPNIPPVDDPSLTGGGEPVMRDDTRTRY